MAKRPLRQWMRDKLVAYATENVAPAAEAKALKQTYMKAAPLVRKAVEQKYKPVDMLVCKKYDLAHPDSCIRMRFENGAVEEFRFLKEEEGPLVAGGNCYNRIFIADEKTRVAVEAWVDAKKAFDAEKNKRVAAYKALVLGSGSVEDVVAVWPEVASLLPADNALIALGPEQMALVNADLKERKVAA
jgi:hypothetical protein